MRGKILRTKILVSDWFESQVRDMDEQQHLARAEVDRLANVVAQKEKENMKVWEQMRSAGNEYQQEFLAKEAAVQNLLAERNEIRRRGDDEIQHLRNYMQVCSFKAEQRADNRASESVLDELKSKLNLLTVDGTAFVTNS